MKSKIYNIVEHDFPTQVAGEGKKGLLLIIDNADRQANMQTLQGLTKAIHHDLTTDITTVSLAAETVDISHLLSEGTYKTIICIGTAPKQVGIYVSAKKYFVYHMELFSLLWSDSLADMNADKAKKMAFWQNLQSLFL